MTLLQATSNIEKKYKKSKSIHTLISSEKFRELFSLASDESKERVLNLINNNDKCNILNWILIESGSVPTGKLRNVARRYGLKNYNRLTPYKLMKSLKIIMTEEQIYNEIFK